MIPVPLVTRNHPHPKRNQITKHYLYTSERALALAQFAAHVRAFAALSRAWGIGARTHEWWAWQGR